MAQTKLQRELEKADELLADLLAKRLEVEKRDKGNYQNVKELTGQLKETKVMELVGDKPDPSSQELKRLLDKALEQETTDRQDLLLLNDAVREAKVRYSNLKKQQREVVKNNLKSYIGDDFAEIERKFRESAVNYLIAVEVKTGASPSSQAIGKLLEKAIFGSGVLASQDLTKGRFMTEYFQRRDELINEAGL
jgi:hypothetical protein